MFRVAALTAACDRGARVRGVDMSWSLKLSDDAAVRSIHWSPYDRVRVVNADP